MGTMQICGTLCFFLMKMQELVEKSQKKTTDKCNKSVKMC